MKLSHSRSTAAAIADGTRAHWSATSATQPFSSHDERPEIEGLRGLAILSLLAVHVAPSLSRGGVIGIDIFFVVSGYLLTRALIRQGAGAAYPTAFLGRRLQRTVPALLTMLIGCLTFATLFTLPRDLQLLGRSMAWGAGLLSNFDAWRRGVLIDPAQALDPLSHLWPVAAIAQGGLLLVLLTWMLRSHPRSLLAVIGLTGLSSLAFNLLAVAEAPGAAFYLLAGRWWELMAGAGLALCVSVDRRAAIAQPDGKSVGSMVAPHLGWLGIGCFAVAIWLADDTLHFPGAWALWPVAGTLCLLAAGPQEWVNRHVFAQPVLRFYGRVSYPLYLWHWPVLCFPLLLGVPLSVDVRVLVLIASVVLAGLTHELIEKPVAQLRSAVGLSGMLLAMLAACAALGAFVSATDGLRFTFPAELQSLSLQGALPAH